MKQIVFPLLMALFLCSFTSDNKRSYPQDYFMSPVDKPIYLSGTFGELRPNHFHAGIDIKAYKGKVGQPLFAAAEGYVSRIKVQSGGYGNVLYMNHPNGFTTVYAHMHAFTKEITDFVKKSQYTRQSFEIDLFPPKDQFKFAKGQVIGKLGTSGRSFGPHLHFEIRDSRTEKPINPLLFGFNVNDKLPPKLHQLKVYFLNDKLNTLDTKTYNLQKLSSKKYRIKGDTLMLGAWRTGFGLKTYDHMNGAPNWNGVFKVDMLEDDQLVSNFEMETFSFSESRYINAHLDYEEQVSNKSYFNRLFTLPGNKLSIYDHQNSEGIVKLSNTKATKVTMKVSDASENEAVLEFWVKRAEVKSPETESYNYLLPFDESNVIDNEKVHIHFPKGALYENLFMKYRTSRDDSQGVYSSVYHIHNYKTPVHRYFDITIEPENLPADLRSKAFIAYCGDGQKIQNCGGTWKNRRLTAKVRNLGDYSIMVDTKPPTITPVIFQPNMKGYSKMTFKIKDNFETTGKASGLKYKATVDGKWILMEFDAKNDLLIHRFDGTIPIGKHSLNLMVTDDRGNAQVFEREFTR